MSSRGGGCLEIFGLVVFALLIGAFAASTWFRHRPIGGDGRDSTTTAEDAAVPGLDRSRIRVEVRNGSGIVGAAGRMTEFLREQGFDVVDFGNADRFDHQRTFVIDRSGAGQAQAAREVAAALQGVPIEAVPPDASIQLDVTVVVGSDLETVLAHRAESDSRGWRGWLDRLPGR